MPDFLIRDLDEHVMKQLKERAEANHRSLQAEIKDTLKRSVKMSKAESMEVIRRFQEETRGRHFTDSVELIREDRDSR